jgi:hypothetical protein
MFSRKSARGSAVLGDLDEQGGDGLGTEKIPNTGSTRNPIFCQGRAKEGMFIQSAEFRGKRRAG